MEEAFTATTFEDRGGVTRVRAAAKAASLNAALEGIQVFSRSTTDPSRRASEVQAATEVRRAGTPRFRPASRAARSRAWFRPLTTAEGTVGTFRAGNLAARGEPDGSEPAAARRPDESGRIVGGGAQDRSKTNGRRFPVPIGRSLTMLSEAPAASSPVSLPNAAADGKTAEGRFHSPDCELTVTSPLRS